MTFHLHNHVMTMCNLLIAHMIFVAIIGSMRWSFQQRDRDSKCTSKHVLLLSPRGGGDKDKRKACAWFA